MSSRPPSRAYLIHRRYDDHNDRPALSFWIDGQRPSLPPLFSFQVYITYDVSTAQDSDLLELARQLFHNLIGHMDIGGKRLDLHFMRPGTSVVDCMERHRLLAENEPDNLADVVVPLYLSADYPSFHSFIIVVSSPEWQQNGVVCALFDCRDIDPQFPTRELSLSVSEARQLCADIHAALEWREEYEEMFQRAQDLGMTEW
ncbi:hypothetical protein HDK90DRAFT_468849 [Phyllosticta capitalensis]|uniref:Uncharacterized protein n=1 Tax=Phyllosticta capitalensis TaxID=121624 RepID=A0ABR1YIA5_9PEZI